MTCSLLYGLQRGQDQRDLDHTVSTLLRGHPTVIDSFHMLLRLDAEVTTATACCNALVSIELEEGEFTLFDEMSPLSSARCSSVGHQSC